MTWTFPCAPSEALQRPFFGAARATLERISPHLRRRQVRFADLRQELAGAKAMVRRLASAVAGVQPGVPIEAVGVD
jgi:hypothetical protein